MPATLSPCRARLWCGSLLALALACEASESPQGNLPPSVILVSLDTVRRDHLSLYGYERDTTPFMDRFAAECVVYTHAYSTSSFTLTSHMSMLTGLYPTQHGVEKTSALSPEIPMLAERLRARGYYNICVARGGWIEERFGYDRGFDVFLDRRNAEQAGSAMRAALDDRPRDRPVFLFLHVFDAHCKSLWVEDSTIYHPPPEFADLFRPGAAERMLDQPAQEIYEGQVEPSPNTAQDIVALYDASVRYLDEELRSWVEYWREDGLLSEALLIVTADHGEALGARSIWKGHGGLWEAGLRVPLLVRFPDRMADRPARGQRDDRLTSSVDFLPTILELLGGTGESWMTGRSLTGEARVVGADAVILAEKDGKRVITDGVFKSIALADQDLIGLWDLARDPEQARELRASPKRRKQAVRLFELASRMEGHMAETPGSPVQASAADEETAADLRAIGYAD